MIDSFRLQNVTIYQYWSRRLLLLQCCIQHWKDFNHSGLSRAHT